MRSSPDWQPPRPAPAYQPWAGNQALAPRPSPPALKFASQPSYSTVLSFQAQQSHASQLGPAHQSEDVAAMQGVQSDFTDGGGYEMILRPPTPGSADKNYKPVGKHKRASHADVREFLKLDEQRGFIGSFVYDSRFKLDKDLKKFGDRFDELVALREPADKACMLAASRRSYLKHYTPKRKLSWRFVTVICVAWLNTMIMLWGVQSVTHTATGEPMPGAGFCTGVFVASTIAFLVLQVCAEAIEHDVCNRCRRGQGNTRVLTRNVAHCDSQMSSLSECEDGSDRASFMGRLSLSRGSFADRIGCSIDSPDWKDVVCPKEAMELERRANLAQLFFSLALFAALAQYTVYQAVFAFYFPQACPTERGPYSCTRLERIIHLHGVTSRFYPPRYNALNGDPACIEPDQCGLEAIPFGMAPPRIINSSVWGKELFGICVHVMPLFFGALWMLEVRRLSTRLAYAAYSMSCVGEVGDAGDDDQLDDSMGKKVLKRTGSVNLSKVEEERNSPMQKPQMHRRRLFFLAMIYHIVIPDFHRSTRRLGRIILDTVDVQDFFLLLLEFDVYEGKPMTDSGLRLSGFENCNFSVWDEANVHNLLEEPRVTCNCSDREPSWWLHNHTDSANRGKLPCEALEDAATEWKVAHEEIWLGKARSPIWSKLDITNWFLADDQYNPSDSAFTAQATWRTISCVFIIASLSVCAWPLVIVFRRTGSWIFAHPENIKEADISEEEEEEEGGHTNSQYWRKRHSMDNVESYMNAIRSMWTVELPFMLIRMYVSFVCGITASSLLIKNFANIFIDLTTIAMYHMWSMSHPKCWPEVYVDGRFSEHGHCAVTSYLAPCISRRTWVQQFSYAVHKKVIINTNEDNIDEDLLLQVLGISEEDIIIVDLLRKNGTHQLRRVVKVQSDKSASHFCQCHRRYKHDLEDEVNHLPPSGDKPGVYIVLPRQDEYLIQGDPDETLESDKWIIYEEFDCEKHVLADFASMFWPGD